MVWGIANRLMWVLIRVLLPKPYTINPKLSHRPSKP